MDQRQRKFRRQLQILDSSTQQISASRSRLQMELSPSLKVYAAVRYCRAFYHGFEFVLLKDRQKAELARLSREMGERAATQPAKPS